MLQVVVQGAVVSLQVVSSVVMMAAIYSINLRSGQVKAAHSYV